MAGDFIQGLRQKVGSVLLPLASITAVVRDEAGRILFERRADFGDAWWGLPGGLMEPGEPPIACLRRELLEETGLRVRPVRLTGVYSSLRYKVIYPNGHETQQVTLCYQAEIEAGTPRPQRGEIEALAFFGPGELPPRPRWYSEMLAHASMAHALGPAQAPYFDPPEAESDGAPLTTLAAVQAVAGGLGPLPWPVGALAALDEQGRVLLRRSPAEDWDLPATPLRVGETLAHTAQRALRAQAGLDLAPARLVGVGAGHLAPARAGHQAFYPVTALFAARVGGGPPALPATARFFERGALPALPAPAAELLRQLWGEGRETLTHY
jgi:ADP-ribose pyrophosphatase YjhB (NUDIX family)